MRSVCFSESRDMGLFHEVVWFASQGLGRSSGGSVLGNGGNLKLVCYNLDKDTCDKPDRI